MSSSRHSVNDMNFKTKTLQKNLPLNNHAYIVPLPFSYSQVGFIHLFYLSLHMQLHFIRNTSAFGNGAVAYIAYVQTESIDYIIKPVLKIFVTIIFKILPEKSATMSSPLIHEIKGQAFRFLKEKIRTARLVLTDVTPVQLMTEEATNENPWPPDTHSTSVISRAAFEVDEYERIVEILHNSRFSKFDKGYWRASYKALILLEHLLTHGPKRVSEEFQSDIDVIEEIGQLQHIDEKGFNWGLSVRKLSERVLKLLRNKDFLKEERATARHLSHAIKGFGSFNPRSSAMDERLSDLPSKIYGRCNSYYDDRQYEKYDFTSLGKKLSADGNNRELQIVEDMDNSKLLKHENDSSSADTEEHHPFDDQEKLTVASLLSV
ncbi:clathrin interactor EPSIN 2 isoform X3 [Vigna angularis]|uniref:clathrin interactor EPSIN 2 isoform X3 n=1 Tax=Phaseolus angularis TaxID=3914 RepID=UPI0022B5A065|nr:clathrin interactor EPSIN 2 isoform X3 [Vigna angularis]